MNQKSFFKELIFFFNRGKLISHTCSENIETIKVFDIDNTIANTWPNLKASRFKHFMYLNLKPLKRILMIANRVNPLKERLVFISAREHRYYLVTYWWLKKHVKQDFVLILVHSSEDKIRYLNLIDKPIHYFDDLSYNHENGEVFFYDRVIAEVQKNSNIVHYGYNDICRLEAHDA